MADAADSKSVGRKAVWVRLPPPAYFLFFWNDVRRYLGSSRPGVAAYEGIRLYPRCSAHGVYSSGTNTVQRNNQMVDIHIVP